MTPYELAKKQGSVHPHTCWMFFYSKRDAEMSTVKAILKVLGLKMKLSIPKGWPPKHIRVSVVESLAKTLGLKLRVVPKWKRKK